MINSKPALLISTSTCSYYWHTIMGRLLYAKTTQEAEERRQE